MNTAKAIAIFMILWQIGAWVVGNTLIMPGLLEVTNGVLSLVVSFNFMESIADTLFMMVLSWTTITIAMFVILLLSTVSTNFREITYNLFLGLQPTPSFAWLPMFMLILGINEVTLLTMLTFTGLCYIVPNFLAAIGTSLEKWKKHCRNLDMGLLKSIYLVYLPSMRDVLLANFKTAWNLSWRTLVALEVVFGSIGSHWGIGTYMVTMKDRMDITEMYASLFIIIAIGVLVSALFEKLGSLQRNKSYGT